MFSTSVLKQSHDESSIECRSEFEKNYVVQGDSPTPRVSPASSFGYALIQEAFTAVPFKPRTVFTAFSGSYACN